MQQPRRSTLAHLQQATTLLLPAWAAAWLVWHWDQSPWLAGAGFAIIVFSYSGFLALEFLALRVVNRDDPSPQPSWGQLARAWLGETLQAPRVFCWRQPFRWRQVPDRLTGPADSAPRRGVVFIHGFICNRGFWTPWLKQVDAKGHPFAAVNLEPVFGSIDDYVPIIESAVVAVTHASGGLPPVLVCHSMGGLAARAWLRSASGGQRVHHVVTIGTPHHGTWLGRFSRSRNARQMALRSDWLRELGSDQGGQAQAAFTCWYSNCDNIVFPASTATLPGADNRLVHGVAHVDLAFQPEVMTATLALLDGL